MESSLDSSLKFLSRYVENAKDIRKEKKTLVLQTTFLSVFHILRNAEILTEVQFKMLQPIDFLFSQLISLSLVQKACTPGIEIDLSVFSRLVHLELNRISLLKIKNISDLKTQLHTLKCYRCEDIFMLSKKGKFQWTEMLELTVQHSTKHLSFLKCMPWLLKLDISNNDLGTIDESIESLEHLMFLNISFNKLESLPKLNHKVYLKLEILIANNNFLSSLKGLEEMISLRGLDLSRNLIVRSFSLKPLLQLESLKWIRMSYNPISFHQMYRSLLCGYIGTEQQSEISIDGTKLDDEEQMLLGYKKREKRLLPTKEPNTEQLHNSGLKMQANTSQRKKVRNIGFAGSSGIVLSNSSNKDQSGNATKKKQIIRNNNETQTLPEVLTPTESFKGLVPINTSTPYHTAEVVVHSSNKIQVGISDSDDCEEKFELAKSWKENENKAQLSDECQSSDEETTETLWKVEKIDKSAESSESLLLVLLEGELKERSPFNNRVICKWSLDSIVKCNKTKKDPIIIDLEFFTEKYGTQTRSYIMEYADAQVLLKKVYHTLEARNSDKKNRSKFIETTLNKQLEDVLEHSEVFTSGPMSSLQSSIEEEKERSEINVSEIPMSSDTYNEVSSEPTIEIPSVDAKLEEKEIQESCDNSSSPSPSETSIDSSKSEKKSAIPKKYDSDIEIISNPSQSSIETLDENNMTPSRKKSSEERQTVAVPNLSTLHELPAPSGLTESSSSGSLTESVVTAYDAHNNKKIQKSREMENFPECDSIDDTLEELNGNITQDIYSYTQFSNIDHRIKFFLDQTIFNNENEELSLFTRCHLWKTGGSDFDGCVAFSNQKFYTFYHVSNDFSNDSCDWLLKNDSFSLSDINEILPLYGDQGIEIRIKNVSYFLLFMDKERTKMFSNALTEKKFKIQKPNVKIIQRLQKAVSSYELTRQIYDPTITHFSVCKSLEIVRNKENEDFTRLAGLAITLGGFYATSGDLSWLTLDKPPSIQSYQDISSLIEVKRDSLNLILRFLDEAEALEEVWTVKLVTNEEILKIIDAVKTPWEELFSVPLDIYLY